MHSRVELFSINNLKVYVINVGKIFLEAENYLIPSLTFDYILKDLPKIKIDRGAIPHICSGADLMAPGVRGISKPFQRSKITVIVDDVYKKYLAVGIALIDSQEFDVLRKGKVVKNLHYVGDKVWDFIKGLI
ncbi:PUA domain-containing protein [[Eubacterium] cellulosolvens]